MAIVLAILVTIVYIQIGGHDFIIFDDPDYVTANPNVADGISLRGISWAFGSTYYHNWHPLTWLSHMLDVQLFGMNPGAFHLVNLFFHIANSILLFLVLAKMTKGLWQSAFVAALFALHPLHVESVAWIAERKDVLSAFFWILTMGAYAFYVEKPGWKRYSLTLVFFILGLMSKPMVVTLPFVLLLLDFWPLRRFAPEPQAAIPLQMDKTKSSARHRRKKAQRVSPAPSKPVEGYRFAPSRLIPLLKEKIPFFALILISSGITLYAQQKIVKSTELYPVTSRILNTIFSYGAYIAQMIWPAGLSIFYPYQPITFADWRIWGAILLLAAISLGVLKLRKGYLTAGWLWYLGTLVPVIGLVQVGLQARADRYTYIPLIGLFFAISWGASEILKNSQSMKSMIGSVAGGIIVLLSILTWNQVSHWKNGVSLFSHSIAVTENNEWAQYNLGLSLAAQDREEEGLSHFQESLRINPRNPETMNNIGIILAKRGELDEALSWFSRAQEANPLYARAHLNLGLTFFRMGKYEDALTALQKAVELEPDNPSPRYILASALARSAQIDKALTELMEVVRLSPNHAGAHNLMGVLLAQKGEESEAVAHFQQALTINPGMMEARKNLESILNGGKRFK